MTVEPTTNLTDEERIAAEYVIFSGQYDDLTGEQARAKAKELVPLVGWLLHTPPVMPMKPGEMVTIPDARVTGDAVYVNGESGLFFVEGLEAGRSYINGLDAAGVRALRTACDRWLATQGQS